MAFRRLSNWGNFVPTKGLTGLSSVLPRISAFCTAQDQTESHNLDLRIQELNEELQGVFGPYGNDHNANPFSDTMSSCPNFRSSPTESRIHLAKEAWTSGTQELSHVDTHGKAAMVNTSDKLPTRRVAIASGRVFLGPSAFPLVSSNQLSKGDVLTVAKLAGICAAKQTGNLIPLCHNINLSNVQVNIELNREDKSALIKAEVTAVGVTGVEMEALTAVSVAALSMYDMCKAVSKHISIHEIQLESKTGGKSGDWCRSQDNA